MELADIVQKNVRRCDRCDMSIAQFLLFLQEHFSVVLNDMVMEQFL